MRIATYNVNGVNRPLEVLQRWLAEASPDVVCLQELKVPQEKFRIKTIEKAGYGVVWNRSRRGDRGNDGPKLGEWTATKD